MGVVDENTVEAAAYVPLHVCVPTVHNKLRNALRILSVSFAGMRLYVHVKQGDRKNKCQITLHGLGGSRRDSLHVSQPTLE